MAANLMRNRRKSGRLLCCLLLAAVFAAGWHTAGSAGSAVRDINASGNLNIQPSVDPFKNTESYTAILYDNQSGLPTSEANAIAQTGDGFIWIGSYAGLIRYDGITFERIESTTGIANVRCLYVDSRDRLWIGTNDTGVFLMGQDGFRGWGKKEGLESTSVRVIAEDGNGVIHIAGTAGLALIDAEMNLTAVKDERISEQIIREIRPGSDGIIYGLTQNGDLFSMKDGKILHFLRREECPAQGILSILPDFEHPGWLYMGTEESQLYYGNPESGFSDLKILDIAPLTYLDHFEYINGHIWICAGNGIGRLEDDGLHLPGNVPMNTSIGHVMTDYEGNLWFTSSRQGVMKIVPNRFTDLFSLYGLPEEVVNTVCRFEDRLFIGTDTGLIVLDGEKQADAVPLTKAVTASGTELEATDLMELLKGVRIRSVIPDSRGRLWISTWRKHGLLRYDRGELMAFTPADGLFSDQIRTVVERIDGSILVANHGGVNIIEGDRITAGYGEKDGITVTGILTVAEGTNNDLILGSDGGGIYITGPDGTKHIGTQEGLNSEVILRIRRSPSTGVYWIVTSNSLAYMTPDYQVTTIEQFPYSNNYDLFENSKGDVWVLASDGVYVVPAETLLANGPIDAVFYNIHSGIPYIATANSYSGLTEDGNLYIAGVKGAIRVNIEESLHTLNKLKIALPYIDADSRRYYPNESGSFILPGNAQRLTVHPYVFSFSLTDPRISYHLEGFDHTDSTVRRSKLVAVDYTNLRMGAYQFVMTVRDPVEHSEQTASFRIVKGKEVSTGSVGTIIIIFASLLLLGGLLTYTAVYRKRNRIEDRLFFSMLLSNIVLGIGELLTNALEYYTAPSIREIMITGSTLFHICLVVFPYLLLLYTDYCRDPDRKHMRKRKLLYGIPCVLYAAMMIANLETGWIFTIGEGNIYVSGLHGTQMLIPMIPILFYLLLSLIRMYRVSRRLTALCILLIAVRLVWDLWHPEISSTSFIYALILVCIHIHVMNQPITDEEGTRT